MPTQKVTGDLVELLKEISEYLSDISGIKNIIQYYWNAGIYAEKLLELCYEKQPIRFPIDISKITEKLGILIEDVNINDFSNEHVKRSNHKIAQLSVQENIFSGEKETIIYVDKYVPEASKRYAITNEIVQYIFHKDDTKIYKNYFVMPMCPTKSDTLVTEIFSIFLLIPMRNFLDEFCKYVKYRTNEQNIPISTEEWIKYLSERAGVSEYYVAYGYQYLRSAAYWFYQAWEFKDNQEKLTEIHMTETEQENICDWMPEDEFLELKKWIFQND